MNKTLFFSLLFLSFVSFSNAQFYKESYREYLKRPTHLTPTNITYPKKDIKWPDPEEKSVNNYLERVFIGKSPNAYSILHSEQRPLFYFEQLYHPMAHSIQYVFEADPGTYDEVDSEGSIMAAYSELEGYEQPGFEYWQERLIVNDQNYLNNPSAVFIKHEESEELEDYYTIISAQDSLNGNWANTAFVSSQINNDHYQESIYHWERENDWARSSMTIKDGEVYIFGQGFENQGDYGLHQSLKHYRGTTEDIENGYNWEINSISPDWLIDPEEGFAYALYTTWSAWSEDGSIGYMWMVGVTNDSYEYGVFQPQVFYTYDSGDTWSGIELHLEDHWVLRDYLQPWFDEDGNPGTVRPSFLNGDRNYPGVVDAAGNLNLFSNVYGSTKGDVLNPADSIWVDPEAIGGHLFDFIISPEGIHNIISVVEFKTKVSTNVFGNIGFDHRLQVGKSDIAFVIGAIWVDDVYSGSDSLINPDIFAWNICSGFGTTGPQNLTEGNLYEGFSFYPTLSENLILHDNYFDSPLILPLTVSVTPSEFANSGPSQPISHFFVNNASMEINWECIWGVEETEQNNNQLTISQNTPNPFSGETRIEVNSNLQEPHNISIEITDILGHSIYKSDEGIIYHYKEVVIHSGILKEGLYFYTIYVGEACQTKKMVVE